MQAHRTGWQKGAEAAIRYSGALALFECIDRVLPTHRVPILMFHRVDDPSACTDRSEPDLISASPTVFAQEMEWLVAHFRPISLADLLAAAKGRALPPRPVLLTIDDGTSDFKTHAWPVLRRLGIPATLCVPTAYIDRPGAVYWQDRLHQVLSRTRATEFELPELGHVSLATPHERHMAKAHIRDYLHGFPGDLPDQFVTDLEGHLAVRTEPIDNFFSWDDLRAMQDGVSVIPHGLNHVRLAGLPADRLRAEIVQPFEDIRNQLGTAAPVFSYPYGSYDADVQTALHQAGYQFALSTRAGFADLGDADPLALRRVNIYHGTLTHFRLDLTSMFAYYLARRSDYQGRAPFGGGQPLSLGGPPSMRVEPAP
jgi:peptidoglycan/xylan/chitin deacetylase (PgdA/CDA1 family)